MRKIIITLTLSILCSLAVNAQVGTWTLYSAYDEITDIQQAGNILYVLSEGDLYSCDLSDNSVQTYDKSKTLSDFGISHIGWCQEARRLVIVYTNQNIDLLEENGNVINISDYYFKTLTEDKTVYGLNIYGSDAYLSTGFGIIKINVKKAEISDTYNLGYKVNWTHIEGDNIIAESGFMGKMVASLSSNLLDKSNWKKEGLWTPEEKTIDELLLEKVRNYTVDGPRRNYFYDMVFDGDALITSGGLYKRSINEPQHPGMIQVLEDGKWSVFGDDLENVVGHENTDNNTIAIDPKDHTHIFVCGKTGIYEFRNREFVEHFCIENAPLVSAVTGKAKYTFCEARFDKDGNLWVLNINQLLKFTPSRDWEVVSTAFVGTKGITNLLIDSRGYIWCGFNHWDKYGLYCYNPQTEEMKEYSKFINEDGVDVTNAIKSIAEDRNGNIWIGCGNGPYYLSKEAIASGDETFTQVKVPRNDGTNLADYLLTGIEVDAIAIDGANRKWFGTPYNGLFVISDDCYTQEYNFTNSNSPLISDQIVGITINHDSGEVYIATDKGLCSYTSDASGPAEELDKNSIYAYPNPVTPDYTGLITITGFTYNASVKIVTAGGSLVAEGISNGGTFTWDGCDLEGRPVASGVYMVMAATEDAKKGTVCKVAIVR